ncbi:hypothetical protein N7517_008654 [Penicillium concentricum]|uniref:Uncharacterized protein n=1 Tax=Penicillium concentricum TaxID=293559 RepID=A0A9W9V1V9_9EURO|nr:uncharacterized protein N7517_008654 [Penicillium concentricum]KAJ5365768.1 hypothetical protein N7517_008654 [Penicillium concentricum]
MKYAIATIVALASLFSQAIARFAHGIYTIESHTGDVWAIRNATGSKARVELVHPEGHQTEHWYIYPSQSTGYDRFIQNVGNEGMLACWFANGYKCEVNGDDGQFFTVLRYHNPAIKNYIGSIFDPAAFNPSGSESQSVGSGKDHRLMAYSVESKVDMHFVLRGVKSKSWMMRGLFLILIWD